MHLLFLIFEENDACCGFRFLKQDTLIYSTCTEDSQLKASEVEVETLEVREETTTIVKETVEAQVEESPNNGAEQMPFEFDEAKLQQLNRVLSRYVGTHNFHNFTARIKPEDPSAKRFILSFEAGKVIEVQGMQFVPCTVLGQSFMLHQIRKMIGTAIAIMRGCVPENIIDFALQRYYFPILLYNHAKKSSFCCASHQPLRDEEAYLWPPVFSSSF